MKHDAYRQIGYIQQALSQNRKSVGVFLGAGCPLAVRVEEVTEEGEKLNKPIIPDVAGLTQIISKELKGDGSSSDYDKLVELMVEDRQGDDSQSAINIEDILSQLRALKQVAGKGEVRGFVATTLEQLDKDICRVIAIEVNKELQSKQTPYHDLAIWARSIRRDKPVHIFTTNYDMLIEQAMEETACPYFDGFIGSKRAFFDLGTVENESLLHSRWSRLWKIHGSINWKIDKDKKVVRSDKIGEDESYLIYPSHLKYDQSRKMPYLAMLDRLKDFILTSSAVLFISGYSFSDDHINDVLLQALQSNTTAMCFAFVFGDIEGQNYEKARQCAQQAPNLSLMGFNKGIIGRNIGEWHLTHPEKIGEIPAGAIKIKVQEVDEGSEAPEAQSFELTLGDFATFGRFLSEMSQDNSEQNED